MFRRQVQGAVGIDCEVRLGLPRRPVVGGLRGGVDHELDLVLPEKRINCSLVADVNTAVPIARMEINEALAVPIGTGGGTEEVAAHIVVHAEYLEALLGEELRGG